MFMLIHIYFKIAYNTPLLNATQSLFKLVAQRLLDDNDNDELLTNVELKYPAAAVVVVGRKKVT